MKSCPTCERTFEDSFTFCLVDGAILSAPFDPQATQRIPEARITNPPPTELFPTTAAPQVPNVPPTVISPLLHPTRPYVSPELNPPSKEDLAGDRSEDNDNPVGRILIMAGVGILLGVIIGVSRKDPRDAIPLALFGCLLGALLGKFSSSLVKLIRSKRKG